MSSQSIFAHPEILEECPSGKNLAGIVYDNEKKRIAAKLERLVSRNKNIVVAYLGAFGSGKSTVLSALESNNKYTWINFEVWRYSSRQDIWDGFVIEVCSKLKDPKRPKARARIAEDIEGGRLGRAAIVTTFSILVLVWAMATYISYVIWNQLKGGGKQILFWKAFIGHALPIIISLTALFGFGPLFSRIFKSQLGKRPLRRVFELEDMLTETLKKKLRKPLVIVIEDIDRATGDGIIFLETLKHFLDKIDNARLSPSGGATSKIHPPIIVIAPQTSNAFDIVKNGGLTGFQSSLKIYDESIYSSIALSDDGVEKFLTSLGIAQDIYPIFLATTKRLVQIYPNAITFRLLKYALRETDSFVYANPGASPVVTIILVLAKYVPLENDSAIHFLIIGHDQARGFLEALRTVAQSPNSGGGFSTVLFRKAPDEITCKYIGQNQTYNQIILEAKYEQLL